MPRLIGENGFNLWGDFMADNKGVDHIFESKVKVDFSDSITAAQSFSDEILALSGDLINLAEDFKGVDLSVANLIQRELEKWTQPVKIEGKLTEKIASRFEKVLAEELMDRDIKFVGTGGEKLGDTMEIPLTKAQVQEFNRGVKKAYKDAIGKVTIPDFTLPDVVLKRSDLAVLKSKFSEKISQVLAKDGGIEFKWETEKDKKAITDFKFSITGEHIQQGLNAFERSFQEIISDPKFYKIEGMDAIEVPTERIKETMEILKNSIGDIDKHFDMAVEEFAKLPSLDKSLDKYKQHLREVVTEVVQINKQIDTLKIPADSKDLSVIAQSVGVLRDNIMNSTLNSLKVINEEISRHPLSTMQTASYKATLNNLDEVINSYVMSRIEQATSEVVASLGVATAELGGKKIFIPSLRALEETVVEATRTAMSNISYGELDIDTLTINKLFTEWSAFTTQQLEVKIREATTDIAFHFLEAQDEVKNAFVQLVNAISNTATVTVDSRKEIPVEITVNYDKFRQKVLKEAKKLANDLVKQLTVIPKESQGDGGGVLGVQPLVKDAMIKFQGNLSSVLSRSVESEFGLFTTALNKEISNLVTVITKNLQKSMSFVGDLGIPSGEIITADQVAILRGKMAETSQNIILNYTTALEQAMGVFTMTAGMVTDIEKELQKTVDKNIKFKTSKKFNVSLDEQVNIALDKIRAAVEQSIQAWEPKAPRFNVDIKEIVAPIKQALEATLGRLGNRIVEDIGGISVSDDIRDKIVKKDVSPEVAQILVDTLQQVSSVSSEKLGGAMLSTVKGWQPEVALDNERLSISIRAKLEQVLAEAIKNVGLKGKIGEIPLDKLVDKINSSIQTSMEEWVPKIKPFAVDVTSLIHPIREALDVMLAELGENIASQIVSNGNLLVQSEKVVKGDSSKKSDEQVLDISKYLNLRVEELLENLSKMPSIDIPRLTSLNKEIGVLLKKSIEESVLEAVSKCKPSVKLNCADTLKIGKKKIEAAFLEAVNSCTPEVQLDVKDTVMLMKERVENALLSAAKRSRPKAGSIKEPEIVTKVGKETAEQAGEEIRQKAEQSVKQPTLKVIKARVDAFTKEYIKAVAGAVAEQSTELVKTAGFGGDHKEQFAKALGPLNSVMTSYLKSLATAIKDIDISSLYKFKVSELEPAIVQQLAQQKDVGVGEFRRQNRYLEGQEALNNIMRENIRYILTQFHEAVQEGTVLSLKEYTRALKEVKIEPDVSAVLYMEQKFVGLQQEIVRKVRKMLDEQFAVLRNEVRGMNIAPMPLGYAPRPVPVPTQRGAGVAGASTRAGTTGTITRPQPVPIPMPSGGGRQSELFPTNKLNPGGDTHTFAGSIINTIRYITAGTLFMIPFSMYHQAATSAKEFDYYLAKAQQNLIIKDRSQRELAERLAKRKAELNDLDRFGFTEEDLKDPVVKKRIVEREEKNITHMQRAGIKKPLQNLALMYGLDQQQVGEAWQIATRRLQDPYEAYNLTKGSVKIYAYEPEGTDPTKIAMGLESILSQWRLSGDDSNKIANMIIKAASMSQATAEELIETQKRAGAVFAGHTGSYTKEESFAQSLALSSMFIQATARTGAEGGTFWRTVLEAPYRKASLAYLIEKSKVPGFEGLSPYKEGYDEKDKKYYRTDDRKFKASTDFFIDILDARRNMTDTQKQELALKVFPRWHRAGVYSIDALLEEMDKELAEGLEQSGLKSFKEYYRKILTTTDEEINKLIVIMQDTWKYKTQRIKTSWQIASFDIFEDLKDEFSVLATYLEGILRGMEKYSSVIALLIEALGKAAVGAGMIWLGKKGRNYAERKTFETNMEALRKESNLYELQGVVTQDRMAGHGEKIADYQQKIDKYTNARGIVQEKLSFERAELGNMLALRTNYEDASREYHTVKSKVDDYHKLVAYADNVEAFINKGEAKPADIERNKALLGRLRGTIQHQQPVLDQFRIAEERLHTAEELYEPVRDTVGRKERRVRGLERAEASLDEKIQLNTNQQNVFLRQYDREQAELNKLGESMANTATRARMLEQAYREMGVSGERIVGLQQNINTLLQTGARGAVAYETSVRNLSGILGLSSQELRVIDTTLKSLIADYERGAITAQAFGQAVRRVEVEITRVNTGMVAPDGSRQVVGSQLLDIIIAQSLFGKDMKRHSDKKFQEILENLGSKGKAGKVASKGLEVIGTTTRGMGKGAWTFLKGGIAPLAKMIPQMALWSAAFDIFGNALGSNLLLQDTDKELIRAEKLKDTTQVFSNWAGASGLSRLMYGGSAIWNTVTGGLSNLLGGAGPSFKDYGKAWKGFFTTKNRGELESYLQETYDVGGIKAKALAKRQEEDEQFLKEHPEKFKLGDKVIDLREVWDASTAKEIAKQIKSQLSEDIDSITGHYNLNKYKLLIKGMREDSEEVIKISEKFIQDQINMYDTALEDLDETISYLEGQAGYKSSPAMKALKDEKAKFEAEKAALELQKQEEDYKRVTGIDSKMQLQRNLSKYGWESKKADLLIAGAKEDSPSVKAVTRAGLLQDNALIGDAITKLQSELNKWMDNEVKRTEIQLKIAELQYEQKRNLVEIKELMKSSTATFNLPAGIKPLTYYEAMTYRNPYKNVTVSSGDVVVNVTLDKSTDTKDAESIAAAVGREFSNQIRNHNMNLSRSILSNIGSNYVGYFGVG